MENKGKFAFEWFLAPHDNLLAASDDTPKTPAESQPQQQPKTERPKPGKAKPGTKPPEKAPGATFGPFKVCPVRGQLEPGGKCTVQTEYSALGDAIHTLRLALLVSRSGMRPRRVCSSSLLFTLLFEKGAAGGVLQVNGVKVETAEGICVSSTGSLPTLLMMESSSLSPMEAEAVCRSVRPAALYFLQGQSSVPCISLEVRNPACGGKRPHSWELSVHFLELRFLRRSRSLPVCLKNKCLCPAWRTRSPCGRSAA